MTTTTRPKRARRCAREPITAAPGVMLAEPDGGQIDPQSPSATARMESKTVRALALLRRPEGATIVELVAATGWLPHTTRAAMTGLRKKGHAIQRTVIDSVSRYTISAAD